MSNVGYATLQIIPSAKGFGSALNGQTAAPLVASGKVGGKHFGGGMLAAARGFAGPLAAVFAGALVADFFKDAVSGASDLGETTSKIGVVFGGAKNAVLAFAKDANRSLGQTKDQALAGAATFGVFGKAAGLTGKDLSGFSTEMVSLSSDLASFHNATPEETIDALGAALRGEAEPMRRFGVLLDDTTLRNEALKQGLIKTTKQALTPQQKTLAAHAVIMRQTKDAQGDFARTSGGLANQQRILTAQWSDMKTTLGTVLLPIVTSVVKVFNEWVPKIRDFVMGFISGQGAASGFGAKLSAMASTLGTIVRPIFASVVSVLATLRNAFLLIWPPIQQLGSQLLAQLIPALQQAGQIIIGQVVPAINGFIRAVAPLVAWLVGRLAPVVTTVFGVVVKVVKAALRVVAAVINAVTAVIRGDWSGAWDAVKAIFRGVWDAIVAILRGAWKILPKILSLGFDIVKAISSRYLSALRALWSTVWNGMVSVLRAVWGAIRGVVSGAVNAVRSTVSGAMLGVRTLWGNAWNGVTTTLSNAWNNITTGVSNGVNSLLSWFRNLPGQIFAAIKSIPSRMLGVGKDMIRGMVRGVGSMAGRLIDKVKGVVGSAVDWAKNILGISSPSKVFAEIGRWTAEGMAIGLEKGTPRVTKAVNGMVTIPRKTDPVSVSRKPWDIAGTPQSGIGGSTYVFNARTVDINERTIAPLVHAANVRERVGRPR